MKLEQKMVRLAALAALQSDIALSIRQFEKYEMSLRDFETRMRDLSTRAAALGVRA